MTDRSKNNRAAADQPAKPPGSGFPIVGIGASAGGLEALKELLSNVPAQTNMAFVVVTHQHPGHTSLLPELLGEAAAIPVVEATDGVVVEPNHVYVAPPGGLLEILNRTLRWMEATRETGRRLPIDAFLRSLAQDQHERAICIILSGTGTDGTLGLKAIKGESGMAMVQQAQTAQYAGMPSSAANTGLADYILSPAAMAKQLLAYAKGPYLQSSVAPKVAAEPLQRIFLLLRNRTGHDFSGYKSSTIRRRIERRMNVHGIDKPKGYLKFIQENPHEIDILFKELLISVTTFFRDPDAFEALAASLGDVLKSLPENEAFRAWVPGCATGEEAYSLAVLLREHMLQSDHYFEVQIFGTDLDADAIETARTGHYPDGIANDVSPQRLERFFTREEAGWHIRKEVREMCIFATQNVIKDAPFTKMSLVSCRNLLIYLGGDLQKRLFPLFHYSLRKDGLLFLGPSESIGTTDLFDPLNSKWKIFRRREVITRNRALPDLPLTALETKGERPLVREEGTTTTRHRLTVPSQIERLLLDWYCPASIVVNDRGDILHIHGRTGAYLEPASGQPRMNVVEMAREGLQLELSHALRLAGKEKSGEVHRENIAVKSNGDTAHINLSVTRIQDPEALRGLFVINFRPVPPPPQESRDEPKDANEKRPDRVEQLKRELQFAKESLQTTIEELETSNEELKSTNEELQSTNEELQSSNEELETSKEEMQSLNEELTTVNSELHGKVEALRQANDDMQNLLNSTDIATIFLDRELNIKRYTEQAKNLVKLIPTDVGRPISDLVFTIQYDGLEEHCRQVFKTLKPCEIEVQTNDQDWFQMRIMPYRTADNVIDGLVITFIDISQIREAARLSHFENIVETVRYPLVVLNHDLKVQTCNSAFARLLDTVPKLVVGGGLFELAGGVWDVSELRELLENVLPQDHRFDDFNVEASFPDGRKRMLILNARRLEGPAEPPCILLGIEEVSGE